METTKNKVKFNFFDVAVIIIMALVLTGFSYIYFLGGNNSAVDGSKTNLEYVLQIEMADEGFGGLVKVGDIVTDNRTDHIIGVVKSVQISDYTQGIVYDQGGQTLLPPVDGYINITLTVECKGRLEGDNAIAVNGCRILSGSVVEGHTPGLTFSARCTSVGKTLDDAEGGN